ncbi:KPN_02809 family neutral zinc metallopeptidase [Pseudonocardia spinosispora]|uniref:KPN_02809 family neutral zinc metallopeptidase n=1 Tax=Pseudonocardia spinosispora TaxID=103441 RepID=UPI000406C3BF|nr:neutral zinc metallopeptidase [Pseudonocardia spinosispora]
MDFNRDAELDTSQVEDLRGSGGGGGGLGGRVAIGGGGVSIVGVILYLLMSQLGGGGGSSLPDMTQLGSGFDQLQSGQQVDDNTLKNSCKTGQDASDRRDCEAVAVINSLQSFWSAKLGRQYRPADTRFFRGSVRTDGCGGATSASGPFYCPADGKVYIDLDFYDELEQQFHAEGGRFARAYVLAHEYGHHVQNLIGTPSKARSMAAATGPTGSSVRLELQADCYAGVWANHAATTTDKSGHTLISGISQDDINAALDTAEKIGDDNIQSEIAHQQVDQSQFTHGSSAQRQKWLTRGLSTGDTKQCDTISRGVNLG